MDDFSMQYEQNGDATVVAISGRLDFLASAGFRAIVNAMKTAKRSNHKVKLACIPDHIAEILETLGMMEILQVYPSIAEAIISF